MRMARPVGGRGFSLIELLVVIGIIALVLSIALPALGSARTAGARTRALANARTVAQSFQSYLAANDDAYPFVAPFYDPNIPGGLPGDAGGIVFVRWYPEGVLIGSSDPFTLSWAWPALVSSVAPWDEHYAAWVSPGMETALPETPENASEHRPEEDISWRLSRSFLADARAFAPGAGEEARYIRGVRAGEVAHPAQKAMLWDTHLAFLIEEPDLAEGHWDAPTPIAFADGHAATHRPQDAAAPAERRPFAGGAEGVRLHDTAGGVGGVDFN